MPFSPPVSATSIDELIACARSVFNETATAFASAYKERTELIFRLPDELLVAIASNVGLRNKMSAVCRHWRRALRTDPRLWDKLVWYPGLNGDERSRLIKDGIAGDVDTFADKLHLGATMPRSLTLQFREQLTIESADLYFVQVEKVKESVKMLYLSLVNADFTPTFFNMIPCLENLDKLAISRNYAYVEDDLPLDATILSHMNWTSDGRLAQFPKVRRLMLVSFFFDEITHGLETLAGVSALSSITMSVSSTFMRNLFEALPNLTTLELDTYSILDDDGSSLTGATRASKNLKRFVLEIRSIGALNGRANLPGWATTLLQAVPEVLLVYTRRWDAPPVQIFEDLSDPVDLRVCAEARGAFSEDIFTDEIFASVRVTDSRGFIRDARFDMEAQNFPESAKLEVVWKFNDLIVGLRLTTIIRLQVDATTIFELVMLTNPHLPALLQCEIRVQPGLEASDFMWAHQHGHANESARWPALQSVHITAIPQTQREQFELPLDVVVPILELLRRGMAAQVTEGLQMKVPLVRCGWPVRLDETTERWLAASAEIVVVE